MDLKLKLSVIIPIYSVENYLSECIESVLNQTYKNIEIILVDDGSPDKCPDICDQYTDKYKNIITIHKQNGGLSDARNKGIEKATGDYITFLDGDDLWDDPKALENIVLRLKKTKPDVLNFSYKKYYEDTKEKIPYFDNIDAMPLSCKTKKEQFSYLAQNHLYIASACNKMIRKELLKEELIFEKGVYSEDVEWSGKLIRRAKSMDFICANFYCYRQRRDSISHTINDKKCKDLSKHIFRCIKLYKESSNDEKELLAHYTAYQYGTFFIVQAQAENEQKECIQNLKKYQKILKYHLKNRKLMILNIVCKIIGYETLCKIIRCIYKHKKR